MTRDGQMRLSDFDDHNPTPAPLADVDGRFRYSFRVVIRNDLWFRDPAPLEFRNVFVLHDLTRDAMDLCVRDRGSAMFVGRFSSPTVIMPYPMIADALARAGQPHALRP